MNQYLPIVLTVVGALVAFMVKLERRLTKCESWIELVGNAAKQVSQVLERPIHFERDNLLRRFRGEEDPPLTKKERRRLAEILEEISESGDEPPDQKLIAAMNAATIRWKL